MKPLKTRFAEPADWPMIQILHTQQQEQWGTSYELPYLFGPNIPVVLVATDETEAIREVVYVERTAEMRFVGVDPKGTAYLRREIDGLAYLLRKAGYRWLECFVPKQLSKMIRKPLEKAGFHPTGSELAHFTKDLRGGPIE